MEFNKVLYYPIPEYENYMISSKGRVLSLNYGSPNKQVSRKIFGHPPMKLMSSSGYGCGGTGYIKLSKGGIETIHKIEDLMQNIPSK